MEIRQVAGIPHPATIPLASIVGHRARVALMERLPPVRRPASPAAVPPLPCPLTHTHTHSLATVRPLSPSCCACYGTCRASGGALTVAPAAGHQRQASVPVPGQPSKDGGGVGRERNRPVDVRAAGAHRATPLGTGRGWYVHSGSATSSPLPSALWRGVVSCACRFGPAHTQRAADNKLLVRSVFDPSLMSRLVIFMEFNILHLEVCGSAGGGRRRVGAAGGGARCCLCSICALLCTPRLTPGAMHPFALADPGENERDRVCLDLRRPD